MFMFCGFYDLVVFVWNSLFCHLVLSCFSAATICNVFLKNKNKKSIAFVGVLELGGELSWWIHQTVPEASGGHGWCVHWKTHCNCTITICFGEDVWIWCVCLLDCAEKLFDLVDSFAESTKRKAAVWPLQIILLILCPNITQDMSRDTSDDSKYNKASIKKHGLVKIFSWFLLFLNYNTHW